MAAHEACVFQGADVASVALSNCSVLMQLEEQWETYPGDKFLFFDAPK